MILVDPPPEKKVDDRHISTEFDLEWQFLTGKLHSQLLEDLIYEFRMQTSNANVYAWIFLTAELEADDNGKFVHSMRTNRAESRTV